MVLYGISYGTTLYKQFLTKTVPEKMPLSPFIFAFIF